MYLYAFVSVLLCVCETLPVPSMALNRLNFIYYISIKQLVLSTLY